MRRKAHFFIILILIHGERDPKRLRDFPKVELQVFRGDRNGGWKIKNPQLSFKVP